MEAPPRIFCCVCALPWPADATCREPPRRQMASTLLHQGCCHISAPDAVAGRCYVLRRIQNRTLAVN